MMQRQWVPERPVSESLARELIEAQFPALAPVRLAHLGEGWDNVAYLVNAHLVFRFPQRQLGADLMTRELAVLPLLVARMPVAVPAPQYVGTPSDTYPWSFAGYPLLAGETACRVEPSDAVRASLAAPLGSILRTLHHTPLPAALKAQLPDTLQRYDLHRRRQHVHERADFLTSVNLVPDANRIKARFDDAVMVAPEVMVLAHGDLYARHLLLHEGRLSGVIDWGDCHWGRAGVDLMIAHLFLPPASHASFRTAYGDIDDDTWSFAAGRAIFSALSIIAYGVEVGDAALVTAGRRALGYLGLS